jgi:uncharacterized protein (TIGR03086 family)
MTSGTSAGATADSAAELYRRCAEVFGAVVEQIGAEHWTRPTPCRAWDVRTVLNHVVGEARWLPPLLAGRTIADVGDAYEGDLLGTDPAGAWRESDALARAAAAEVDEGRPVALSFGTVPASEYLRQVAADHLIHAWDLAEGVGIELRFPDDVLGRVAAWFARVEENYRAAGAIGPRVEVPPGGDAQTQLLARFGRARAAASVADVITAFGAAFNSRDLDAIMAWTTPDCVFESTTPPDGVRYEGRDAVREVWAALFAQSADASFEEEARWVDGDRAVVQWRYDWGGEHPGHVRGLDLLRVRGGLIAEKLSYVKG